MTQLWNLSIGEVKDFNKHVEEIIKYHLASLPKLTAASQLDNGSYSFDTNNELGVVTFSDANYLSKILYASADTSNVDNFIASLKRISETIPNCECLIQLHDLLSKNKVFANKYMMVFNKPIISKIEIYIQLGWNFSRQIIRVSPKFSASQDSTRTGMNGHKPFATAVRTPTPRTGA